MSPEAAAEEAVYRRLKEDVVLTELLGSGTRVFPYWPQDTLQPADTPRLTFSLFGPPPVRPGTQRVRIPLEEWVWPTGATGGRSKLLAVDGRLLQLFDEQHFTFGGYQLYAVAGAFRDFPGGPKTPMRRQREIVVETSPLT